MEPLRRAPTAGPWVVRHHRLTPRPPPTRRCRFGRRVRAHHATRPARNRRPPRSPTCSRRRREMAGAYGKVWAPSPRAESSVVNHSVFPPPVGEMRTKGLGPEASELMNPSGLQAAPDVPASVSVTMTGGPPRNETTNITFSRKNPTRSPSGATNGENALGVPGTTLPSSWTRSRTRGCGPSDHPSSRSAGIRRASARSGTTGLRRSPRPTAKTS